MGWNTDKFQFQQVQRDGRTGTARAAAWTGAAGQAWDALKWKISCTVALPKQTGKVTATQNRAEHDGLMQAGEDRGVIQLLHNNTLGNGWLGSARRSWKGWNHNQKGCEKWWGSHRECRLGKYFGVVTAYLLFCLSGGFIHSQSSSSSL